MDKKSFVILERLRGIKRTYLASFYLYDEKGTRGNAARFKQALPWNRGYKKHFVVRTTSNLFLLDILRDMGCGTDYSPTTELMMSRVCDFPDSDIMFSSNNMLPGEFTHAEKLGIIINLDDVIHIQCLEETPGRILETINCRFNPDGLFEISNNIMDNPGDSKYDMIAEQTGQAFRILKEKGAKHLDIHAFLVDSTATNEYYPVLAKILPELAVKLKEETGVHIASTNLSDGTEILYCPDQKPNDTPTIGDGVRRVYEKILVPAGMDDVALYTELGRFTVGPYGALMTKATHGKHTCRGYVGVDTCAVNPVRSAMHGTYHHVTVMGRGGEPCTCVYDVVGSLCGNSDKFVIDHMLPGIKKGDPLFTHDAGVHGPAMGYSYNERLKSAGLLLKKGDIVEMIRRAEIPEDCFATFDFCGILRNTD